MQSILPFFKFPKFVKKAILLEIFITLIGLTNILWLLSISEEDTTLTENDKIITSFLLFCYFVNLNSLLFLFKFGNYKNSIHQFLNYGLIICTHIPFLLVAFTFFRLFPSKGAFPANISNKTMPYEKQSLKI